jgi:hypothetical protein
VPILVDGSNLGGRLGGARGARAAAEVVRVVLAWSRTRRGAVVVVLDGPPRGEVAERYGRVTVRWSGARSADELILDLTRRDARHTRVVTDDAALAAACRAEGAEHLSVAAFAAGVRPGVEEKETPGAIDVADWERWFAGGGPSGGE